MYKDNNGDIWQKVQLHLHTTLSDGALSPDEVSKMYLGADFDAIAITDHWKYFKEQTLNGINVLSGCEFNVGTLNTENGVMHIVGVGLDDFENTITRESSRQEIIDGIKKLGGLAILAHPAWSLNTPNDALTLKGFDAVEIYNSVSAVGNNSRPYSGYFVDLLANENVFYPLVATDDAHAYIGLDNTISYIMVKALTNSKQDILSAIKKGDFYATQGPNLSVKREGDKIIVDCSNCVTINFLSNLAWAPNRIFRGENLTHAEYAITENIKWVRVEVLDKNGKYAWSNIIKIK